MSPGGAPTLGERIAGIVALDPSKPAVEFESRWRTWGQLGSTIAAVAEHVREPGFEVGVILRNRPASVGFLLGVLRAGGCVVTINPQRGVARTRADIEALDLGLVVGEPDDLETHVPKAAESAGSATLRTVDLGEPIVAAPATPAPPDRDRTGRPGVAVRMLTSGTTGPPKRIDLTYATLERVLVGAKHYESDQDDRLRLRSGVAIVNSPLVHLGGLFRVLQCVNDGRSFSLLERFTVDGWLDAVRRHRPKTVSLVPAALRMVLEADVDPALLASVRSVVSGTAPLSPDDADTFTARYGIPVLVSYAATEFGGGVAGWNLADHQRYWAEKRGSVGRAHAGCEFRVVDPDDDSDEAIAARARGRGPARGQGGPARRRGYGSAPPTSPASTTTGSCGSWVGPTRRSSAAGSRSGPTTCAPRSNGIRTCGAPRSSAFPTPGSGRCRSPRSSCAADRRRSPRSASSSTPPSTSPATSCRRRSSSSTRSRGPRRPRSTSPPSARCSPGRSRDD